MSTRIFMSVPDGPYWKLKEARERARQAGEELEAVRGAESRRQVEAQRRSHHKRVR